MKSHLSEQLAMAGVLTAEFAMILGIMVCHGEQGHPFRTPRITAPGVASLVGGW